MRRASVAFLATLCIGCLGGGIVGSSTVTGVYTLRSVNGSPLPFAISTTQTGKTEILDDAITLYEGFTFAELAHTRITTGGQVTEQAVNTTGSYSLMGNSVFLVGSSGGQSRVATVEANVMTFVNGGLTSIFKK
jgi:hypothetical protein